VIPDDLDEIFLSEKSMKPSSAFIGNVMARVRIEALKRDRMPFPWIQFSATAFVILILAIWFFPSASFLRAVNSVSYSIGSWFLGPGDVALRRAVLSALASIVGSLMLVWFSFRLTGAVR
jgi:hypothetical protein